MIRFSLASTSRLLCGLLFSFQALAVEKDAHHAVILQYHHIAEHTPPATTVAPDMFRKHLQILKNDGFQVLPLPEIVQALRQGQALPDRTVAITFDDAYADIGQVAAPLLKEFGFPFTIFVSTDFVDHKQHGYLTWDELRQLKKQGATLANHSRSHLHLLRQPEDMSDSDWQARLKDEIQGAEQRIQKETGEHWRYFAYPYGEADEHIIKMLNDWGYISFGQGSGALDKTLLESGMAPRFPFNHSYQDPDPFRQRAQTLPLPLVSVKTSGLVFEQATIPELTLQLKPHTGQLSCFASGQGAIDVIAKGENRYLIRANKSIPVGRSRYNCTLPVADKPGRYHWFSQVWIRKNDDGSWYPEP